MHRVATVAYHGAPAFELSIPGEVFEKEALAGLYDHEIVADELARRHPAIDVDPRALYVDEGPVLTSAGVAAGIDLCLHIVRRDHGQETANAVARRMVVAAHRDGGQAQYVERPLPPEPQSALGDTLEWMLANVDRPLELA